MSSSARLGSSPRFDGLGWIFEVATHLAVAVLFVGVLLAVGQPIITDDLWWHLAMGGHYAERGPWIDLDPFLYLSAEPPAPAAWLFGLGLHATETATGFYGLRILHVCLVALIGGLAWNLVHRVSGSRVLASLGLALLLIFGAFRLFQFRPHLVTLLATLLILRLIVVDRSSVGAVRIACVALIFAVWANMHGAFLVGLFLLAAATVGAVLALWVGGPDSVQMRRRRAWALGAATLFGTLGSVLNPAGWRVLTPFFVAGADTPDLSVVADEWAAVDLWAIPVSNLPPTPAVWALIWILLLTAMLVGLGIAFSRKHWSQLDWTILAVGAVSMVGMLSAVRLNWLGFVVALALVHAVRVMLARNESFKAHPRWGRLGALVLALVLCIVFFRWGDWPMISQGVTAERYALPYSIDKYHGHGVWFLRDAGVQGHLFADYWFGNFLSYWLTPDMQLFVNGSLNVPTEIMDDGFEIRAARADPRGRTPSQLLDRHEVDVFFGTGLPTLGPPGRPPPDTTRHLHQRTDWRLVFRNRQTAIWLRDSERNQENFSRIEAYYAEQGIPFDADTGFDPLAVIRESPHWAHTHGLIPRAFRRLERAAQRGAPAQRRLARRQVVGMYAALGEYERAAELDVLPSDSPELGVVEARGRVWLLLMRDRGDEALVEAQFLNEIASPNDRLSGAIVAAAERFQDAPPVERSEIQAMLPWMTRPQGSQVMGGFSEAPIRFSRP